MTVWRGLWNLVVHLLVHGEMRKRKNFVLLVFFFYFSRPRALWAFYFIIHIKHRNQRGDCYLNSIRKSWLLDPLHFAHLDHLPTDTWSWFKKSFAQKRKNNLKKEKVYFYIFFYSWSVNDTRSAWRYCNTRATLGRGAAQAPQDLSRGLNNSLKLMWRHAPRTRD